MERKIDRFDKYMRANGLNDNKVTLDLALSVGTIGKSRKEGRDLSDRVIDKILNYYGDINPVWLLAGEGEMLKNGQERLVAVSSDIIGEEPKGTPVYDIDVTCGREYRGFQDETVIGYVDLPNIRKDSHIVTASGESMQPKIMDGDKIVLREIMSWDYIYYGQIYLVLTSEYRLLKYIRKHPTDESYVILRSENKEFDDIELPKSKIIRLFIVENILRFRNMV